MAMQYHLDNRPDKVTPPSILIKNPLTPPPTDSRPTKRVLEILEFISQRKRGRAVLKSPWHKVKLHHAEYHQLLTLLEKEESLWVFVETKLRYDYNSLTETLVLRMPTRLHEKFLANVVLEIESKLRAFRAVESRSGAFAQKIKYCGSERLDLGGEDNNGGTTIRHDPDLTFEHCDALWPGVVIELSYSQKRKDLPHLADDYIVESDGSIRVVVGLDIDYETKKGTVSMWRPRYVTNEQGQLELEAAQTLNNQVFRDDFGRPNLSQDAGLKLELRDFAPEVLASGISGSFLIDSATLCGFLDEAEESELKKNKQKRGIRHHLIPGAKRRRREETPPEQINSEDERRYADEERRVEARESADDSSYHSSPS
ncbi:MAG: hypothetical protein Q9163_001068 [Psora crenata]